MKFLILLISLIPALCWAQLDEEIIYTTDKKCALRYLTTYSKENWSIQTNLKNCSDGFVQGYAQVDIYDAQNQLTEKISGFFVDGYWLGDFMGEGHVLDRTSPEEHQQALTLILGKEGQITYVGQLRATQEENRSYGAFMGCPDFRIMAVVQDENLFNSADFQDKIAQKANQYAHMLCSELETIALFGSTILTPKGSDIIFQMTIDPETQERQIIPLSEISEESIEQPVEFKNETVEVLFKTNINNNTSQKTKTTTLKRTALAHLDTLYRLTNQPVKGRIIVHVKQLNLDGSAFVDLPQPVLLKNSSDLKTGWMEITGVYSQGQMSVHSVLPCSKKWCEDVL